jgi:cytochrome P450
MRAASDGVAIGDPFGTYIDWRAEHPSDDIMTELLNVEFEDQTGTVRRLTRDELLTYIGTVSAAGNETTTLLIGWAGKVLAEHPGQRRQLVENPALIPRAIEELGRYEPPVTQLARYVMRGVQFYGHPVPNGSTVIMLTGAANRDHRQFPLDGDVFDIHRNARQHLGFGVGIH